MRSIRLISVLIGLALAFAAFPQDRPRLSPVRERYQKYEYMIPMRDGVKLYTAVYVPKTVPGKHPILMERTPYGAGPYGSETYKGLRGSPKLQEAGYIFAFQDVRGKNHSEGDYVNIRPELKSDEKGIDESTDTYDTVDYLVKNVPDNNGHVGLWGISYPGFYAGVGAINSHPALTAVSPQAPVSNWFVGDDFHHNGALFLQDAFDFLSGFGRIRYPDGHFSTPGPETGRGESSYDFFLKTGAVPNFDTEYFKGAIPFWNDLLAHPDYDQWWKDRSLPDHMRNVHSAVLVVGGWFDAEDMWGALNLYKQTKAQNSGTPVYLCMGPWYHGMWASPAGRTFGDLDYGTPTSTYFQDNVEFPFFERYLNNKTDVTIPPVTVFQTGANKWQTFDRWPANGLGKNSFYFGAGGTLTTAKPKDDGSDSYDNDPSHPTPYQGNPNQGSRTREYMIEDQRWADSRPDVLTYRSDPVAADTNLAGPVDVDLWVSTTGTDSDFVVKLIDVWPADSTATSPRNHASMANYEEEVRADIFRGKFRDSYSNPKPFKPGQPTRLHFHMNSMNHTLLKGHKLEIQIQSDWFPLVDRNPNVFENINAAKDSDFQKATIKLYRSPKMPSHVTVGE